MQAARDAQHWQGLFNFPESKKHEDCKAERGVRYSAFADFASGDYLLASQSSHASQPATHPKRVAGHIVLVALRKLEQQILE